MMSSIPPNEAQDIGVQSEIPGTRIQQAAEHNGSDYGDFDDEEDLDQLEQILTQLEAPSAQLLVTDIEDYEPPGGLRLPKIFGTQHLPAPWEPQIVEDRSPQAQLHLPDPYLETRQAKDEDGTLGSYKTFKPEEQPDKPDTRTPLERFRKPPKKTLSVTDLVSPAWCELQYFYTLSKHGKKRRTPAMKQGTKIHQALEDEVHTTVPVEITKKEDGWGLRIFNTIQGLRTLRETGRTRELEIWGAVGGEIVLGVIDEISYTCPDPAFEAQALGDQGKGLSSAPPESQASIVDYLATLRPKTDEANLKATLQSTTASAKKPEKRIYISDVKTRSFPTLPTGASVRPTVLQLHLYHHLLENLAQGNFSLIQLAERFNFNTDETFSDAFIARIGNLNQDLFNVFSSSPDLNGQVASSQDSMDLLTSHNTPSALWDYMLSQFRETFLLPDTSANEPPTPTPQSVSELPNPAAHPTRLSPILTAEYIAPTYKHVAGTPKKSLGKKCFVFNADFLKSYLEDNLAWWRGEREARGVELQEAWKCRSCDFRDSCEWIHDRDNAALEQALERRRMRQLAGVEGGAAEAKQPDAVSGVSKSKV